MSTTFKNAAAPSCSNILASPSSPKIHSNSISFSDLSTYLCDKNQKNIASSTCPEETIPKNPMFSPSPMSIKKNKNSANSLRPELFASPKSPESSSRSVGSFSPTSTSSSLSPTNSARVSHSEISSETLHPRSLINATKFSSSLNITSDAISLNPSNPEKTTINSRLENPAGLLSSTTVERETAKNKITANKKDGTSINDIKISNLILNVPTMSAN